MKADAGPDCTYREGVCDEWLAVVTTEDDDGVLLTGSCSRCTHRTSYPSRIVWKAFAGNKDTRAEPVLVLIHCDCQEWHPPVKDEKRPDDAQGCGSYWYFAEPVLP